MFSLAHLKALRLAELDDVAPYLPHGARVLEIGAGTGEQAVELARRGFDVSAIDVPQSNYRGARVFDVIDYDGVNIPLPSASVDVVFSSNVLEHVARLDDLGREMARVLKPGGRCVHLVPTPAWRLWTALTAFPAVVQSGGFLLLAVLGRGETDSPYRSSVGHAAYVFARHVYEALLQPPHGERGNRLTEAYYFSRRWWLRHFERTGMRVVEARPGGLFYTGHMVLGPLLPIGARRRLAHSLGSACHLFVLEPAETLHEGYRDQGPCRPQGGQGRRRGCRHPPRYGFDQTGEH
jgi:SAM-dependent methyltransferase